MSVGTIGKRQEAGGTHGLLSKYALLAEKRNFASLFKETPIHFEVPSALVESGSQVRYQPEDFPSTEMARRCKSKIDNLVKMSQRTDDRGEGQTSKQGSSSARVSMESAKAKPNMIKCEAYLPALVKLGCTCPLSL